MVVLLPDPFREMGAWRNSTKTQQSGHAPRSGPVVKNGSSAKDGAPEAQMRDKPGGELDPEVCPQAQNSTSVLSCIGKRRL